MTKHSDILDFMSYDAESGSCKYRQGIRKGQEITAKDRCGYLRVQIGTEAFQLHRLIYFWVTGEKVEGDTQIDHVNGVRDDNRWVNLRLCSVSQNNQNAKCQTRSRTQIKGINQINIKGKPYWRARVTLSGKNSVKHFGFNPENLKSVEEALTKAVQWLDNKRVELHGDFANFG